MNYILIFLLFVVILAILIFAYLYMSKKSFKLHGEKIPPKVSVVFIVKNNETLLDHVLTAMIKLKYDVKEIVVLDMGSIDNTLSTAKKLLKNDPRGKIYPILNKSITKNYFALINDYVTENIVFLLDLYKIGKSNPNIYVPDLFKPLNTLLQKGLSKPDKRIDGTKLLYFDKTEREKNHYILREYIIETLSNIRMQMEIFTKDMPQSMEESAENTLQYLDKSIKNITLLTRLIGSVEFSEKALDDNMLSIFNDYSKSHGVSIDYKVLGVPRNLKKPVSELLLTITQDLLYSIIQYNLSSKIYVQLRYGVKNLYLVFSYGWAGNENRLLDMSNGLSYYILHSIQNRLSFLNGKMRIYVKSKGKISITIHLPLDSTICENKVVPSHEK